MQSIYKARKTYYDDTSCWWSVKPKEYSFLKDMDLFHQIAGQVYFTNKSIENELEKLSSSKYLVVDYEQFCKNPAKYYQQLCNLYSDQKYQIDSKYKGSESFVNSNKYQIEKELIAHLESAYDYFLNSSN